MLLLFERGGSHLLTQRAMRRTTSGGTASSLTSTVSLASTGEHSKLAQVLSRIYTQNVGSALHPTSLKHIWHVHLLCLA